MSLPLAAEHQEALTVCVRWHIEVKFSATSKTNFEIYLPSRAKWSLLLYQLLSENFHSFTQDLSHVFLCMWVYM